MAFAKAVANATGAETIKFLMELITSYGVPKYFCSDRGTHFKNKEVEETCKLLGITQVFSSAYHPQTNEIPEIIKKEQEKQKLDYDKTHRTITFEPGQQVLVKFHFQEPNKTKKLAHKYRGPFKVVEKISDSARIYLCIRLTVYTIFLDGFEKFFSKLIFDNKPGRTFSSSNTVKFNDIIEALDGKQRKFPESRTRSISTATSFRAISRTSTGNMFQYTIICMFILRTCSPMEPLSITVSSGAFFNEIKEAITYDKSIPLIYTQKTITEESNFSNNLLE
ncbi:uncharacterized protein LOC112680741, partial [Sipha flava]|uniref:Uncharacterized protein LOC112680741 n=1 Tax=Sipha flava TaxID=143950 RepID=A0A8B8F7I8_9HEMI